MGRFVVVFEVSSIFGSLILKEDFRDVQQKPAQGVVGEAVTSGAHFLVPRLSKLDTA